MEKVYVVTDGWYSDYSIKAIFSDKEVAEKYKQVHGYDNDIEEWPVNNWDTNEIMRTLYSVAIDIESGKERGFDPRYKRSVVALPGVRTPTPPCLVDIKGFTNGYINPYSSITGRSFISYDHALKVAADKRTMILAKAKGAI